MVWFHDRERISNDNTVKSLKLKIKNENFQSGYKMFLLVPLENENENVKIKKEMNL